MDVAILGPSHPWRGGIAHHTASLYEAFDQGVHKVDLLNFRRLYPSAFFPGKSQRDPSRQAFRVPGRGLFDPVDPLSWVRAATELVLARPDRLVLQWWHPFCAPGYAAVATAVKAVGCEVVMMCHNVEPHESTPVDRMLSKLAYACPDRFVVQSETQARVLARLIGHRRAIQVVSHPRYTKFSQQTCTWTRRQARRHYGVDADYLLVFFGLIRPYKGLDLLLQAVADLPDDLDWQLIVAGEVYGTADPYRHQIGRLGLSDRVRMSNRYVPNEDVAGLFRAADRCVLPYRHATGSGAANAALACQTPVIMSRLPTLVDAFDDQPVEWFRPADISDLRDAIVRSLRRPTPPSLPSAAPGGWQRLVETIVDLP